MSLSCYCGDDYEWWYNPPNDYSYLDTKRSRKCCSCGERIAVGELQATFECWKFAEHEVERRIYGDDGMPLAAKHMCERCADLYYSLEALGYCITLGDDMRDLVAEYAELHQRRPQT